LTTTLRIDLRNIGFSFGWQAFPVRGETKTLAFALEKKQIRPPLTLITLLPVWTAAAL